MHCKVRSAPIPQFRWNDEDKRGIIPHIEGVDNDLNTRLGILSILFLPAAILLGGCVSNDISEPRDLGVDVLFEEIESPVRAAYGRFLGTDPEGRVFLGCWFNSGTEIQISADGGDTWESVEMAGMDLRAFVSDGAGVLFAWELNGPIFRSEDHGATWEWVFRTPPTGWRGYNLMTDDDGRVYAWSTDALFRSDSAGDKDTWIEPCDSLPWDREVWLVTRPGGGIYYYSRGMIGVSFDHGVSWEDTASAPCSWNYDGLIFDSAGNAYVLCQYGIFVSEDGFQSWDERPLPVDYPRSWHIDGDDRLLIRSYTNLFISSDGGLSWDLVKDDLGDQDAYIASGTEGNIYIYNEDPGLGILRSGDSGESWDILGFAAGAPYALFFAGDGTVILGTISGGIYRRDGLSTAWECFCSGWPVLSVSCLGEGPGGEVMAGVTHGVFLSPREDHDWSMFVDELGYGIVDCLVFSGDTVAAAAVSAGVYLAGSSDVDWTYAGLRYYGVKDLDLTPGGELLAAANFGGVFRYIGEGVVWDQINEGLHSPEVDVLHVTGRGDVLAGAADGGIYLLEDGGDSWRRIGQMDFSVVAIFDEGGRVYAADKDAHIFWSPEDLSDFEEIDKIYPDNGGVAFLGMREMGVDDSGHIWIIIGHRIFRSDSSAEEIFLSN